MILVEFPANRIHLNVTAGFCVFLRVADDPFVIISLSDRSTRPLFLLTRQPCHGGLKGADDGGYGSNRGCGKSLLAQYAGLETRGLDVQDGVQMVRHDYEFVEFGCREVFRNRHPTRMKESSQRSFAYLSVFDGTESALSIGGADREEIGAGL